MGGLQGKPVTVKHSEDGTRPDGRCFGASSCQGWRATMEDAHNAVLDIDDKGTSLFAVYDGHGGKSVAEFAKYAVLHEFITSKEFADGKIIDALQHSFMAADHRLVTDGTNWRPGPVEEPPKQSKTKDDNGDSDDDESFLPTPSPQFCGTTAVVAVIVGNTLYVSNSGDSRCIIAHNGKAEAMSNDHKPDNPEETERIQEAGGTTFAGRVNGRLAVSRALGDFQFKQNKDLPPEKQMVSAFPEVKQRELSELDDFLVLACDGVWDVMSNQECVEFVGKRLGNGNPISSIVEEMFDCCIAPDPHANAKGLGCDNMTAIVVPLSRRACDLARSSQGKEKKPPIDSDVSPSQRSVDEARSRTPYDDMEGSDIQLSPAQFQANTPAAAESRKVECLKQLWPLSMYDVVCSPTDDDSLVAVALAQGDSVAGVPGDRSTPLHRAIACGNLKVAASLIAHKASLEGLSWDQCTPLHCAAETGNAAACRLLLEAGASLDALGQHGRDYKWAPLHFAAANGHTEAAGILLDAKADINVLDANQRSPIVVAAGTGNVDILRLLLDRGAEIDLPRNALVSPGENQVAPLYKAAHEGHLAAAHLLIQRKANINAANSNEATALHIAAERGLSDMVSLLLDQNANINSLDEDQATALHVACQVGQAAVVTLLLQRGADTTLLNYDGKVARQMADNLMEAAVRDEIARIFAERPEGGGGGQASAGVGGPVAAGS
mmetsp:Transcript_11677/g.26703  ORF Transcript_11677/g.26703 Transcript_11677/m.26703 type:complete len:720 (+) Transcript_11677:24-2183(+)